MSQTSHQSMLPEPDVCERARLSRDERFDGRFVVGVVTTGIYCRPVCPARPAAKSNVRYFVTPAAARDAGFRPCLRCRPEIAALLPEWRIGNDAVMRGLRLIETGFLDSQPVAALASRLELSERHLNRLFQQALGTSPKSLARTRRLQIAKRLIDGSRLSFAEIALHAGFGSVRRFNDEIRAAYGRPPGALRRETAPDARSDALAPGQAPLRLCLPVRQPYDPSWVFGFLEKRALRGVESVTGLSYRRRLDRADGATDAGWLEVTWRDGGLVVELPAAGGMALSSVLPRVRRLFDLTADSRVVDAQLSRDPRLAPLVARYPGLRVPGAWDGFETSVRAILGQQVSVARATILADLMVQRYGGGRFPSPEQLRDADPAELGMPGRRGAAIRSLAQRVAEGDLVLDESAEPRTLAAQLCALPGVGPWTAAYVGMRVARDPDAFPDSDWVVLKMLGATPSVARRLARPWQPWRAYAVMLLWRAAEARRQRERDSRGEVNGDDG